MNDGQGVVPNEGGVFSGEDFVSKFNKYQAPPQGARVTSDPVEITRQPSTVAGNSAKGKGKAVVDTNKTAEDVQMKSILEDDEGFVITKVVINVPEPGPEDKPKKSITDHFKGWAQK